MGGGAGYNTQFMQHPGPMSPAGMGPACSPSMGPLRARGCPYTQATPGLSRDPLGRSRDSNAHTMLSMVQGFTGQQYGPGMADPAPGQGPYPGQPMQYHRGLWPQCSANSPSYQGHKMPMQQGNMGQYPSGPAHPGQCYKEPERGKGESQTLRLKCRKSKAPAEMSLSVVQ
ncbi:zinc finger MIZ domain-containing protein 2-like isoform 2-T3 [Salvelinus alpinus]